MEKEGIMVEIRGIISKETDKNFRQLAMKKFGYGKGSISKALEEALHDWIETNSKMSSGDALLQSHFAKR